MNDYPIEPLAAALGRVIECEIICPHGGYYGSMRRLLGALQGLNKTYRDLPERPHSAKLLRDELERRAVELHRSYGIVVSIYEPGDESLEEVFVERFS